MEFTIRKPSDLHTHVRQGEMLPEIARITAFRFAYIEVMPNTTPSKQTGPEAIAYYNEIRPHTGDTEVIVSIKITPETTEEIVEEAVRLGVKVGKLYFGITTNEAEGARGIEPFYPGLRAMEKYGMILSVHGEAAYDPDGKKIINLRREAAFIPIAEQIIADFPHLKVIFEHITTGAMVNFIVNNSSNRSIAATITDHHLRDDIDSILGFVTASGEGINPHNYRKPIPKFPEDRDALVWAATNGLPCFFYGSDSAPHATETKECCCGKPGVFSAMTRIETLAEVFEKAGKLNKLEGFASIFGPLFYGVSPSRETITLVKEPWQVPVEFNNVTNYRQGEEISWRVKE